MARGRAIPSTTEFGKALVKTMLIEMAEAVLCRSKPLSVKSPFYG